VGSDDRFEAFAPSPIPTCVCEGSGSEKLIFANEAMAALVGVARDALVQRPRAEIARLFPSARGEAISTRFQRDGRDLLLIHWIDRSERRAESTSSEELRRLKALLAHMPDGLSLTSASGICEYVSPAVTRLFGYAPEEIVGRSARVLLHPEDAEESVAKGAELRNEPGATRTFVARNQRKDGAWLWIESTVTNFLDEPDVRALVTTFRDVTEQVTAIDALRKSQARLESLLSATAAVMYVCEAEPPYGATFISANITNVLGHSQRAFLDTPHFWADNIHPDDREPILAEVGRVFEVGWHVHEYRFRHADGTYRWMHDSLKLVREADGKPREMIGCFYDITAQRSAQEAIHASEANFRALIEGLPAPIFVHRGNRILYVNPAAVALLGYARADEIVGRPPLSLIADAYRAKALERMERLEREPGHPQNASAEGAMLRRDGSHVPVQVVSQKLDFDGAPASIVLATDLTERRQMLARLSAAERLASMGTLAAGVAHELNNPLTYVLTNLSLLADELPALLREPERARLRWNDVAQLVRDARDGGMRIRNVVRDLQTLSRKEEEHVEMVDVREVLESCLKMTQNELRYRARLVKHFEEVPFVEANASRLGQVFLNLVVNALQSMSDQRADTNELRVTARAGPLGDVVVGIGDTGGGIAPENVDRIFEPFFTTKPMGEGTGLGLAICHGIIRALRGEIRVESDLGRGTTVWVTLPRATSTRAEANQEAEAAGPPARHGRILVVDDEESIGRTLQVLFRGEHDVTTTTRAREALERITAGERFDAILCDLMMPEMSGMLLFDEIGRIEPALAEKIIFLTGGAFTPSAKEFLARVANARLEKPFQLAALRALLSDMLG
jgi:two-component system cell cycle sensor histidine kinase/response regulator CckA